VVMLQLRAYGSGVFILGLALLTAGSCGGERNSVSLSSSSRSRPMNDSAKAFRTGLPGAR
jgi:hypothetical protein